MENREFNHNLLSTGARWHAKRKMLTPMFHFKMLESYMETMNKQAKVEQPFLHYS